MEHSFTLIATLAWGLVLSLVFGFIASRLRIPALVGYLLAGVAIAPTTPGFVGDVSLASQLSELGVTLLMFGVGLHFSLRDLLRVKSIAVPGAVLQMAAATVLGAALAIWRDWNFIAALILGLSLSCASTVVLIRALQGIGALESGEGQVAVGWLVVEDLATVLLLVLLPSLSGIVQPDGTLGEFNAELGWTMLETAIMIVGFMITMLVIGRRVLPWVLMQAVKTGSREIFTLCVIAIAIGVAYASTEIFKVSFALGAFFAGMMMRESEYAHRAAQDTLPLQDAFSVIFFLGVGMLFDPSILIRKPFEVFCVLAIIILGKSLASVAIVRLFGYNWRYALTIGASLAQVGEFSFILGALGVSLGFLPEEGMTLILAGAIFSIALNPLVFKFVKPLASRLSPEKPLPDPMVWETHSTKHKQKGPVVLVGASTMGRDIAQSFNDKGIPCYVIEQNVSRVSVDEQNRNFILGDASQVSVLERARVPEAEMVVITVQDALLERKIADEVFKLNARAKVVALVTQDGDRDFFKQSDGTLLPNVLLLDSRKELAKNLLFYSVGLYRRG